MVDSTIYTSLMVPKINDFCFAQTNSSRARSVHDFYFDFSVRVSDFLIGRLGLPTAGENEFSKTSR